MRFTGFCLVTEYKHAPNHCSILSEPDRRWFNPATCRVGCTSPWPGRRISCRGISCRRIPWGRSPWSETGLARRWHPMGRWSALPWRLLPRRLLRRRLGPRGRRCGGRRCTRGSRSLRFLLSNTVGVERLHVRPAERQGLLGGSKQIAAMQRGAVLRPRVGVELIGNLGKCRRAAQINATSHSRSSATLLAATPRRAGVDTG